MRDPTTSLVNAIQRDSGGFAVVFYPDLGLREWLAKEVESLLPDDVPRVRASTAEEALAAPDRAVLLIPIDEASVVEDLDALRDQFLFPQRQHPVVVFLLRDGDGQRALSRAPSFASLIRGSDPDPEMLAELDVDGERVAFLNTTGESPEAWLRRWRAGDIPTDPVSLSVAYRAMLLEM